MELINNSKYDFNSIGNVVATIGAFDGMHLAHQHIFNKMKEVAKIKDAKTMVISFYPHPDYVLSKRDEDGYLQSLEQKQRMLENIGIDYLYLINFDKNVASMDYNTFTNTFLKQIPISSFIVGKDFHYGINGEGNVDTLAKKYNVIAIDLVSYRDEKLGSDAIRSLLNEGNIKEANKILGYLYAIEGEVSYGSKIGSKIGVPTANITLDNEYLKLKKGVYLVRICYEDKAYKGICNVGNNPTMNYVAKPRLEVHIFDFSEDIYNKKIKVEFIDFIRPEMKFDSVQELVAQINEDIKKARRTEI